MGQTAKGKRAKPRQRENGAPGEEAGDPGTWLTGHRNPAGEKPEPCDATQGPDHGTSGRRLGGRGGCRQSTAEVAWSPAARRCITAGPQNQAENPKHRLRKTLQENRSHVQTRRDEHTRTAGCRPREGRRPLPRLPHLSKPRYLPAPRAFPLTARASLADRLPRSGLPVNLGPV